MSKVKMIFRMSLFARSEELEQLHSIREFAELTGYEKSSVYNLINAGKLRCVKIGRSNRIPRSAIDEFLANFVKPRASAAVGLKVTR